VNLTRIAVRRRHLNSAGRAGIPVLPINSNPGSAEATVVQDFYRLFHDVRPLLGTEARRNAY
jgi:hypothetical protein